MTTPIHQVVDITKIWEMADRGDLTHEQFFNTVGVILGKRERTPESKEVGRALALVADHNPEGVRMLRSLSRRRRTDY